LPKHLVKRYYRIIFAVEKKEMIEQTKNEKMVVSSFKIEKEVLEALREKCYVERTSISEVVRQSLQKFLKAKPKK